MPLGITALALIASGALGALGSEAVRSIIHPAPKVGVNELDDLVGSTKGMFNMGGYELVGAMRDVGAIGADFLLSGVESDDILLSGIEDLISGGEDEALLEALSVSGMGNTELVGAVASMAKKAKAKKVLASIAERNAGAVVQRGLDRRRRYPLGFVPTSVASATAAAIPSAPQNLFRPERLVIPSDIAFDFGVRDIKVGNQSQLVQSVEVPAALFSEVAINTGVTFDTAEVGNQVSVDVRNKSGGTLEFSAGLVGSIAK